MLYDSFLAMKIWINHFVMYNFDMVFGYITQMCHLDIRFWICYFDVPFLNAFRHSICMFFLHSLLGYGICICNFYMLLIMHFGRGNLGMSLSYDIFTSFFGYAILVKSFWIWCFGYVYWIHY